MNIRPIHSTSCSNQNAVHPDGKYLGAAECDCEAVREWAQGYCSEIGLGLRTQDSPEQPEVRQRVRVLRHFSRYVSLLWVRDLSLWSWGWQRCGAECVPVKPEGSLTQPFQVLEVGWEINLGPLCLRRRPEFNGVINPPHDMKYIKIG